VQNYLIFFILSFLFTQKERTKEKAPEMPTSGKTGAPKLSAALIFFGYFFLSREKSNN
jgi:hypothetical protein